MKNIVAIISTFAILLCFANAQAGGNDPDCCMSVCCVVNGQYKCSPTTINVCHQGQKYASGPKCGAGNNGFICKKPANNDFPSGNIQNGTNACTCRINGKCAPVEECEKVFGKVLQLVAGLAWLLWVGGLCCCCAGLFCLYYCCCGGRNGRGRTLSITARQPGQSYIRFAPDAVAVAERVESGDSSYMEMK